MKPKTKAQLEAELLAERAVNHVNTEESERFKRRIREQMRAFRIHWSGTPEQMLDSVLQYERNHTEAAISGAKDFRDNCLIMLKSLEVVLESVECAFTHSEKNARLRGLADVIHRYQDRLGRFEFCFDRSPWYATYNDVFRREDPRTAKLREKIAELEAQLKPAENKVEEPPF